MRRSLLALAPLLSLALAQCTSYGTDYTNNGNYNIDKSSNEYFSFSSIFSGCQPELINPVLVSPEGNQYACSSINIQPTANNAPITSTCGIPYSLMNSGAWKIVLQGNQIAVQRNINLSVGVPQVITVTATATVVVGVTTTAKASTVTTTVFRTNTLVLPPETLTRSCPNGATQTRTSYVTGQTVVITSIATRTETVGGGAVSRTTTVTRSASCHLPDKRRGLAARETAADAAAAAPAAVAATTVTVTQTTYTATSTRYTTVPAATTATETTIGIRTVTSVPVPSTFCSAGGQDVISTRTITLGGETIHITSIRYTTVTRPGQGTIVTTITSTYSNAASATACWRQGGFYGKK